VWTPVSFPEGERSARPILASRFTPGVGWEAPAPISSETETVVARYALSVTMTQDGDGIVLWTEHDGAGTSVWTNRYTRSGGWGVAEAISELLPTNDNIGTFYDAQTAELATDREGHAIAIWVQDSGGRADIWTNRFVPATLGGLDRVVHILETQVLVLTVTTVVLAAALAVMFVSYRTLRRQDRPTEAVSSGERNTEPQDPSSGLVRRESPPNRGGAASAPPWRRWPANNAESRLTAKERILLHLLDFSKHSDAAEFPPELTSNGIGQAVGIDSRHVAQYIRPLVKEGLVRERTARVRGVAQRRKVYTLDAAGWQSATGIRERVLFLTVRVRDESGDRQATVAEILAATHGHRKLLDVMREVTEMGVVTLSAR